MMLVLSRKLGESITISENITVQVVQLGNGRVRLGIEAPPEIPISRSQPASRDSNGQGQLPLDSRQPVCTA